MKIILVILVQSGIMGDIQNETEIILRLSQEKHARKHYTEASYENSDRRRHKMNACKAIQKAARRANRRLDAAICRDALLSH